jgi:hypothetical protein
LVLIFANKEWDKKRKNDGRSGAGPGRFGAENRAKRGAAGGPAACDMLGERALYIDLAPHRMVRQNYRPGYPFQMDFFPQTGGYFQLFASCTKFYKFIKISIL